MDGDGFSGLGMTWQEETVACPSWKNSPPLWQSLSKELALHLYFIYLHFFLPILPSLPLPSLVRGPRFSFPFFSYFIIFPPLLFFSFVNERCAVCVCVYVQHALPTSPSATAASVYHHHHPTSFRRDGTRALAPPTEINNTTEKLQERERDWLTEWVSRLSQERKALVPATPGTSSTGSFNQPTTNIHVFCNWKRFLLLLIHYQN